MGSLLLSSSQRVSQRAAEKKIWQPGREKEEEEEEETLAGTGGRGGMAAAVAVEGKGFNAKS